MLFAQSQIRATRRAVPLLSSALLQSCFSFESSDQCSLVCAVWQLNGIVGSVLTKITHVGKLSKRLTRPQ